jgi:adenosine kinase
LAKGEHKGDSQIIMQIIVSGSLAYDRIMDFPGHFSDHILPEKIHVLNVSFQVNGMKEKFGGTAGNIAYSLNLLGEHPLILASIGHDYRRYFDWLNKNGISTQYIKVCEEDYTACAYITTDMADNQITGFHAGAMKYATSLDFQVFAPRDTLAIISPGNMEDMINYPRLCKARGIDYIFDPGQSLPMWRAADLVQSIQGCRILICNDYEIDLISKKTGQSIADLLKLAESIIVTKGDLGSAVYTPRGQLAIPVVKPRKVVDPTGAGDAYRGGLIRGLIQGRSLEDCARMGSTCASFCLESYGTQEYRFSLAEFNQRLATCI